MSKSLYEVMFILDPEKVEGNGEAADAAALQFLSGTVVFDPANTCNACGHGHTCSMDCAVCRP